MGFAHIGGSDCPCDRCYKGGSNPVSEYYDRERRSQRKQKPNFQSFGNKSQQSRSQSAQRAGQRDAKRQTNKNHDTNRRGGGQQG